MNIVLCGMMGCGKTTVAAALSELTGMEHADTDEEVVKRCGRIADIFEKYGEARFRELETEAVRAVCSRGNAVIATGGGCVLKDENVALLKSGGKIVFLRARAETLVSRLRGDTERPLLAGGVEERVKKLLEERTQRYVAVADEIVDTDGLAPCDIAEAIAKKFSLI